MIKCPPPPPPGHETKIFMNATRTPSKRSSVERIVDKIILFMFSVLFSMCLTGAIYFGIWTRDQGPKNWYLKLQPAADAQYDPEKPAFVGFASFITSFILYGEAAAALGVGGGGADVAVRAGRVWR